MQLQLIKIEDNFFQGTVIFHEYVTKTAEQMTELERKKQEKLKRKLEQEKNIKRKKGITDEGNESDNQDEEQSDEDWYKEEVGEAPRPGELVQAVKKRK